MSRPRVGMIGAGQLARMTYPAAIALDVELRVLAARADDSAAQVVPHPVVGDADDLAVLDAFAAGCDVVTFDHELIAPEHLAALVARGHVLRPAPEAKRFAQDKAHQRARLAAAGLPVPRHRVVQAPEEAITTGDTFGWPLVLKAPRGGYDGRGVWMAPDPDAVAAVWPGAPLLAEAAVPITRELAVVVATRAGGESVAYPVVETVQSDGICTELVAPAPVPPEVAKEAEQLGLQVAAVVGAAGILAVELFWTGETLLVNEVAARPHNSGHWTIEGSATSQFANHLRGVLGWSLGDVRCTAPVVATVNVLGPDDGSDPSTRLAAALEVPGVAVHLYGKAARPGRKLGHVTARGDDVPETRARARRAATILTGGTT